MLNMLRILCMKAANHDSIGASLILWASINMESYTSLVVLFMMKVQSVTSYNF